MSSSAVAAYITAAVWLMNSLASSSLFLSLVPVITSFAFLVPSCCLASVSGWRCSSRNPFHKPSSGISLRGRLRRSQTSDELFLQCRNDAFKLAVGCLFLSGSLSLATALSANSVCATSFGFSSGSSSRVSVSTTFRDSSTRTRAESATSARLALR